MTLVHEAISGDCWWGGSVQSPVSTSHRTCTDVWTITDCGSGLDARVHVSETDKECLIKAELRGLKKEAAKLFLSDGRLAIRGGRRHERDKKTEKVRRLECAYDFLTRIFVLPEDVEEGKLSAGHVVGVLHVHLPKSPPGMPNATDIRSNSQWYPIESNV